MHGWTGVKLNAQPPFSEWQGHKKAKSEKTKQKKKQTEKYRSL